MHASNGSLLLVVPVDEDPTNDEDDEDNREQHRDDQRDVGARNLTQVTKWSTHRMVRGMVKGRVTATCLYSSNYVSFINQSSLHCILTSKFLQHLPVEKTVTTSRIPDTLVKCGKVSSLGAVLYDWSVLSCDWIHVDDEVFL